MATPSEVVEEFISRLTADDLDGACELLAEDVEYDNVPVGKNHGPDAVRQLSSMLLGMVDETQWIIHRQLSDGSMVMNERTDRFRQGERWFDLPVMGVFEVSDGAITLWRDYFDMGTMNQIMADLA